jgi:hypothetical protein
MTRIKRWRPTLKKWTEAAALRATITRMKRIEALLVEIAGLWSDEDEFICSEADELKRLVEGKRLEFVISVQTRVEERAMEAA